MFPAPGTTLFSRDKYAKHLTFFAAGAEHKERALLGGNQSGKTTAGGYETALHLTGRYPDWWVGKRFDDPITAWAVSDTAKVSRDVPQKMLVGPPEDTSQYGTGLIPADCILRTTVRHGLADAVETVSVRHTSGGTSTLAFKSAEQGREAFQGSVVHVLWYDEEPPLDVYTEGLMRTVTVGGIAYITATPLRGLSEVVLQFLPNMVPTAV